MTLRLILMRHAKSAWDDPLLDDHARVLNARGRKSASAIGAWMQGKGYQPDLVLCSSASRTKETWQLVSEELTAEPKVEFDPALFLASPETMLARVTRSKDANTILLIAHNPGSAYLAELLALTPSDRDEFCSYPTAATTVFEFDVDEWNDVKLHTGQIIDFVVPRDLI